MMKHRKNLPAPAPKPSQRYWRAARALTLALLLVWGGVTFGVLFFARELAHLNLFGVPFSFYMAAQGLTLIYFLLVAIYVVAMHRFDDVWKAENDA